MKRALWSFLGVSLITLLFTTGVVRADSIVLTPDSPTSWTALAFPGETLVFSGTIAADALNSTDVFLNNDQFGSLDPALMGDTASYFINLPVSLAPGLDSGFIELFSINVPGGTAAGVYAGSFEIKGGADDSAQDFLADVPFNIKVLDPPAVPEPASLVLLGGGVVALFATRTRLRR